VSDPDVQVVLDYIDRWVMDGHSDARAALERINKRLAVGAALADVFDGCVNTGYIKPVKR